MFPDDSLPFHARLPLPRLGVAVAPCPSLDACRIHPLWDRLVWRPNVFVVLVKARVAHPAPSVVRAAVVRLDKRAAVSFSTRAFAWRNRNDSQSSVRSYGSPSSLASAAPIQAWAGACSEKIGGSSHSTHLTFRLSTPKLSKACQSSFADKCASLPPVPIAPRARPVGRSALL